MIITIPIPKPLIKHTANAAVFCPTSNLFLGSGLFDNAGLSARGITNGVATDVGGGTSYSMLQTLNEGYKVLQLRGENLHPLQAFHWITRGNAAVLGLEDQIGTLDAGTDADIVVLNASATSAMALRMARTETLSEELFALQRAIRTGDGEHPHAYFTRTRSIRRGIIDAGQDTDAPDFGRKKT